MASASKSARESNKLKMSNNPIETGPSPRFLKWSGGRQSECRRHKRGRVREGDAPSGKGGSGYLPRENFVLWVPLSAFYYAFWMFLGPEFQL